MKCGRGSKESEYCDALHEEGDASYKCTCHILQMTTFTKSQLWHHILLRDLDSIRSHVRLAWMCRCSNTSSKTGASLIMGRDPMRSRPSYVHWSTGRFRYRHVSMPWVTSRHSVGVLSFRNGQLHGVRAHHYIMHFRHSLNLSINSDLQKSRYTLDGAECLLSLREILCL